MCQPKPHWMSVVGTFEYYDSQLSMTLGKFGDKVSALKLPCCQGQLPLFPRVTFGALLLLQMVTVKFKVATVTS